MRRSPTLLPLLLLPAALLGPSPRATAQEAQGVRWAPDLEAGLLQAAQEGRPVLLALNALETEAANNRLATVLYPSAAWGEATRDYVCFVANGNDHPSVTGSSCARYGAPLPCEGHKAPLRYLLKRFAPETQELISPQHVVLEPDGGLAFRKEYYTGRVGPDLLRDLALALAPERTYLRAGAERAERVDAFEKLAPVEATEAARTWLRSGDALAAAGILCAFDFSFEPARRLALVRGLDATPPNQVPLLAWFADGLGATPDEQADAALALGEVLLTLDRPAGVRLLAQILVGTAWGGPAAQVRRRWQAEAPTGPQEGAARREAFLLARPAQASAAPAAAPPDALWAGRLARAERKAGLLPRHLPPLSAALEEGPPGVLWQALLEATPEEVRANRAAIRALFDPDRVRLAHAAALACLGAGLDPGDGLVETWTWSAVQDPLDGPDLHPLAVDRLGGDPGSSPEAWGEAIAQKLGRSR